MIFILMSSNLRNPMTISCGYKSFVNCKKTYFELIDQSYYFPRDGFDQENIVDYEYREE